MSQASVTNPGSPTAYVGGSAALVSATASAGVPPTFINAAFLSSLVSIAPDGTVHYDNSKFSFLAAGQSLSYTINFDVQSGSDTLHLSLTFTVTGINEAPTITFGALDTAIGTIIDDTRATTELAAGNLSFKDADSSDTHSVSFRAEVWACNRRYGRQNAPRYGRSRHDGGEHGRHHPLDLCRR
jgi:VCBS repeat-containing protein